MNGQVLETNWTESSPKELDIMSEPWKYLVILDACRYDYFASTHSSFLRGRLRPIRSRGSCTLEFLKKTFTGRYEDVIYISSNPYANSRVPQLGFDAKKHFGKVVDVWLSGWDKSAGTVPPGKVNESALISHRRHPDKRLIVHYMQPHAPYVNSPHSPGYPFPTPTEASIPLEWNHSSRLEKAMRRLEFMTASVGFDILGLEVRRLAGLPPAGPMDAARRRFGLQGLRRAYSHNLASALHHIRKLCMSLTGPMVVTADHGELLGDGGKFGHPCGSSLSLLRHVPWFEVAGPPAEGIQAE